MEEASVQPKRKGFRFLRILFDFIIYLAIVGAIVVGLPKFLSWKLETPFPMAAITSGSMWPALKEGDLVFIRGVTGKQGIKEGDIVVYRNKESNTFTIHRIVKLRENDFITKGDANFKEDAPSPYDALVGKTVTLRGKPLHLPYLGSITVIAGNFVQKQTE